MIRYIKGEYLYYEKGAVIVETASGIGFRIFVPETSPILLQREGDTMQIYTYMQVKDDGMLLYGFSEPESLRLFEQLISVNGVGPKAGLAIMSLGSSNTIKSHILNKDAKSIAQAQGIGKKTSERVILELADKVSVTGEPEVPSDGAEFRNVAVSEERNEAAVALTTLGYTKSEAETAVGNVADEGLSAEEYVRKALKYLL